MLLRQEDHAHAVLAGRRQGHALLGHVFAVELVRDLDQDTGTVAHQRVGADRAAVIQVFQDLQALQDDLMALLALDMSNHADAAGVFFIGGVVHALGLRTRDRRLRSGGRLCGLRLGHRLL